jgi:Skp family chaperone for outer membrane proteins
VLVVSRTAVLERTQAAERLATLEREMTTRVQAEIDAVKAELTNEEEELARLRTSLPREEFEARVATFDRRVRRERREAQSKAAALQQAFRDARRELVAALDPILEEVRVGMGARVIVNAESVLAADPSIDITRRVIALFDERVSVPVIRIPELEPGSAVAPEGFGPGGDPD